jgi:hypothetical protein
VSHLLRLLDVLSAIRVRAEFVNFETQCRRFVAKSIHVPFGGVKLIRQPVFASRSVCQGSSAQEK